MVLLFSRRLGSPVRLAAKNRPRCQAFAVEVIQHIQKPERPAVTQPVRHEIRGRGHIGRFRHRKGAGFVPFQPLVGLDTQVQLQLAVSPLNPFVVSGMALDIAQVQKT